jgi:hypothetical protein
VAIDIDRAAFSISEPRLSVTTMHTEGWDDPAYRELGVSVCRFSLTLAAGRLRERCEAVAIVSLHGARPQAATRPGPLPWRAGEAERRIKLLLARLYGGFGGGHGLSRVRPGGSAFGLPQAWSN